MGTIYPEASGVDGRGDIFLKIFLLFFVCFLREREQVGGGTEGEEDRLPSCQHRVSCGALDSGTVR